MVCEANQTRSMAPCDVRAGDRVVVRVDENGQQVIGKVCHISINTLTNRIVINTDRGCAYSGDYDTGDFYVDVID